MNILLTGGNGLLGKELQKLRDFEAPSKEAFDITSLESMWEYLKDRSDIPELIVNCAAYTKVELAEIEKEECYKTNVLGVRNLTQFDIPILHISTAYVFDGTKGNYREYDAVNPLNYYSLTKALAEEVLLATGNRLIRTLFKPRPWPFYAAYTDQITTGMYVDEAAKEINQAIDSYVELPDIVHIGGKRQTIYELARESKDVKKMSRLEVNANLPEDVSLNCTFWKQFTGEIPYGN